METKQTKTCKTCKHMDTKGGINYCIKHNEEIPLLCLSCDKWKEKTNDKRN